MKNEADMVVLQSLPDDVFWLRETIPKDGLGSNSPFEPRLDMNSAKRSEK